jgi:hypothetical protein
MKKQFLLLFILLLPVFCQVKIPFESINVKAQETQLVGLIIASCVTLDSVKQIAKADETSKEKAVQLFLGFETLGICGRYPTPRLAPLEKKILTYIDYSKNTIELWKIKDLDLWSLVDPRRIEIITIKKNNLKTNSGHKI